jgi:hypothetical protein
MKQAALALVLGALAFTSATTLIDTPDSVRITAEPSNREW